MVVLEDGCCGTRARLSTSANLHAVSLVKLESDEVLSSRDVAIHLYATARLGPDYIGFRDIDYITAVCKRLFDEVESLNQRAICMILWSINTMRPSEDGGPSL